MIKSDFRTKKKNKTNSFTNRLRNILDENYFHTCIKQKENSKIEWTVYYKNLPNTIYFSSNNRVLLTSDKNTTQDIYILKEKFEKEKRKEFNKHLNEYIGIYGEVYRQMLNILKRYSENIMNLMLILLSFNIFNMLFAKSNAIGLLLLVLIIILAIFSAIGIQKIEKEIDIVMEKLKEKFIYEKIRRQGFNFINKIKE